MGNRKNTGYTYLGEESKNKGDKGVDEKKNLFFQNIYPPCIRIRNYRCIKNLCLNKFIGRNYRPTGLSCKSHISNLG
jgi:hypothetical protein